MTEYFGLIVSMLRVNLDFPLTHIHTIAVKEMSQGFSLSLSLSLSLCVCMCVCVCVCMCVSYN